MKSLRILVTFKKTEQWIYDEIVNHSGRSGWIKDILAIQIRKEIDERKKISHFYRNKN